MGFLILPFILKSFLNTKNLGNVEKMEKRHSRKNFVIFLCLLIFLIILSSIIASSLSDALEYSQVKKPYSWLKLKCIGKWQTLRLDSHASCLLALNDQLTARLLNDSVNKLLAKSLNGNCWPSPNCNVPESSLAKIALYDSGYSDMTENVTNWTLNKKIPVVLSGMDWYLQIIQNLGSKTLCSLDYDNAQNGFEINESGFIISSSDNIGDCFTKDRYWLKLNPTQECLQKNYNLTCNDSIKANFLFKSSQIPSPDQLETWYVLGNLRVPDSAGNIVLNLSSYCISEATGCSYESTLWAAYAFYYTGDSENARKFLPYLISEEKNNLVLMPPAFLYYLTGEEDYANETGKFQKTDGFISVPGSSRCKYYDTALGLMLKALQNAESFNMTKLEAKLLNTAEQKREGSYFYWSCSSNPDESIRDTSLLLVGLGLNQQTADECTLNSYTCVDDCTLSGGISKPYQCSSLLECCEVPETAYTCSDKGGTCKSNCFSNETQFRYTCTTGVCCKLNSQSSCVSELQGKICSLSEECINSVLGGLIPFITSVDSSRCCRGNCSRQQSCTQLGGEICNPNEGKSCQGANNLPATESDCCRQGFCIQGQLTCSQKAGIRCNSGEECKDGTMVDASDTNGQMTCCTAGGRCLLSTCSDSVCQEGESCSGDSYETMDAEECCDGTCGQELLTCSEMNGHECTSNMKCSQNPVVSEDVLKCCLGTCKEKPKVDWTLIIILIVVIALAILLFWLIKSGKIKMKDKKEEDEFGFGGTSGFSSPGDELRAGISAKGFSPAPKNLPVEKAISKKMPVFNQAPVKKSVQMQTQTKTPEKKPVKKKPGSELDENLAELEKLSK